MGRKLGRPRAGAGLLSREQILSTALELIDAEGIETLTMRRLAATLGVDPMAIYHHLPNKPALLAGVTDRVFGELQLPPLDGQSWQQQVRAFADAYCALVRAHPNLVLHLITSMSLDSPALLAANEALYAALAQAGLAPQQVVQASDLLVDYLNGWALGMGLSRGKPPVERQGLAELFAAYPPDHYPTLRRTFAHLTTDPGDVAAGLEIILAGIAALAAATNGD